MKTYLSVAISGDGYMDDRTDQRLVISSKEDWDEVYALRALSDAILVGAQTVRSDNPSLVIRSEKLRQERIQRGQSPDIVKVTISSSGELDPTSKFFTEGAGEKVVFCDSDRADHLADVAHVIRLDKISPASIITELERMGIERLFVEGGAQVIDMFMQQGMVDTLRIARNPQIEVGDPLAVKLRIDQSIIDSTHQSRTLGGVVVDTYSLLDDNETLDRKYLTMAIEQSLSCRPSMTSYCVGAVVVTANGELFTGYTHESSPTHHAEQEAINKALSAGATLRGASIYASMEPCSVRSSEPESCSEIIIRNGFKRAVFALYEPTHFVTCKGALNMRQAGVEVAAYPSMGDRVLEINKHVFK